MFENMQVPIRHQVLSNTCCKMQTSFSDEQSLEYSCAFSLNLVGTGSNIDSISNAGMINAYIAVTSSKLDNVLI